MSTYTRGEAAGLLAVAIGVPNKDWLSGWSSHEIGCGVGCKHPQNNLWACGQAAPGATNYNDHGVKNYPTLVEAIAATAANLHSTHHPEYGWMIHDLQQGKTDSDNIRAGLRTWCGSTCYSNEAANFVAAGRAHNGDQFDDSGGGGIGSLLTNATCESSHAGSCKLCQGGIQVPNACPTGEGCVIFNSDGSTIPAPQSSSFANGVCVSNDYINSHTPGGIINPTNGLAGLIPGLPAWLANPDWARFTKAVLGVLLIGFGFLLLFAILTEKAEGNPAVKTATKALALGA